MQRMAVVAPENRLRRVLVEVADAGVFEPDPPPDPIDETSIDQRAATAPAVGRCGAMPGWIPSRDVGSLRTRIAPHGGGLAELAPRRGIVPPTTHGVSALGGALRPLVTTYATVPYRDLDPTLFAAVAYMLMFGMMFGDVAHGLALVVFGVVAHRSRSERLHTARTAAAFLIGAGAAATGFGLLYGEAFGPTGLVPTLWLRPLDKPDQLLIAGLAVGSCLLASTFVLATVNRWRESGPAVAIYDASGIGGALLFAGTALFVGGRAGAASWMAPTGIAVTITGAVLTFVGLFVQAGAGASGIAQAVVEMFDTVLRLGSNVVSFSRLAAFGLTHAVISEVVWNGTVNLWDRSTPIAAVAAIALFAAGNVAGFALGALVGAIQALRLEYYEIFSRLFSGQGRPFEPWHIPIQRSDPS
jgi:V/A-type H+/Na+-transporting ATPase subunit I